MSACPSAIRSTPISPCAQAFRCIATPRRAKRRGADGFRYFGYSLGHYYVFGQHQPGVTQVWEALRGGARAYGRCRQGQRHRHARRGAGASAGIRRCRRGPGDLHPAGRQERAPPYLRGDGVVLGRGHAAFQGRRGRTRGEKRRPSLRPGSRRRSPASRAWNRSRGPTSRRSPLTAAISCRRIRTWTRAPPTTPPPTSPCPPATRWRGRRQPPQQQRRTDAGQRPTACGRRRRNRRKRQDRLYPLSRQHSPSGCWRSSGSSSPM